MMCYCETQCLMKLQITSGLLCNAVFLNICIRNYRQTILRTSKTEKICIVQCVIHAE